MAKTKKKTRKKAKKSNYDIQGIGLVVLSLGILLAAIVSPIAIGGLGQSIKITIFQHIGLIAYLLPLPFLILGLAFFLNHSPKRWFQMLLGYIALILGIWLALAVFSPFRSGSYGIYMRLKIGLIAYALIFPAFLLLSAAFDVFLDYPLGSISRNILQSIVNFFAKSWRGFWAFRKRMKERAEFAADVAIARKELKKLDEELDALQMLFPSNVEVKAWQKDIARSLKKLRPADIDSLTEAEINIKSWKKAIKEFTKGRAEELKYQFANEGIDNFSQAVKETRLELKAANELNNSLQSGKSILSIREELLIELNRLNDRYGLLTRQRDKSSMKLKKMSAKELLKASENHNQRLVDFEDLALKLNGLRQNVVAAIPWTDFLDKFERLYKEFPAEALKDLDERLYKEIKEKNKAILFDLEHWQKTLDNTEITVREARAGDVSLTDWDNDEINNDWDSENQIQQEMQTYPEESSLNQAISENEPDEFEPENQDVQNQDTNPKYGAIDIQLPSYDLLDAGKANKLDPNQLALEVQERVKIIDETLADFKLQGRVVASIRGPSVTRFEVEPAPGEKISRFANLADDLAMRMKVGTLRIEAPIMGKSVIGLEVPNANRDLVQFRAAVEAKEFRFSSNRMPIVVGKTIDDEMLIGDLAKMPHLLIAGSTGSGKSVAVNTLISSLLYGFLPTELRFLMIDPKMVELTPFDGIPHLLRPVVTNPNDAASILLGAVAHMERRYQMMRKVGAKNLDQYNEKARNLDMPELPLIVIVIDELADLMITSPKEVEGAIMRLAQMARATGMHLVLATQRPSVDILTSLIKVNVPARMAFAVSSSFDSRTILGAVGAERLIGNGDMLFYQPGLVKPVRVQGPYISENEIPKLCDFLRRQYFEDEFIEAYGSDFDPPALHESSATGFVDLADPKLRDAAEMVVREGQASVSRFQRRLSVGHARAGKLMDSLEDLGIVGPHVGSKSREVLVLADDLDEIFARSE